MATTHPLPAPGAEIVREPGTSVASEMATEGALVPSPPALHPEPITLSPPVARLPVELEVAIPVREFRVRNLLALEPGQLIETQWEQGDDLPLSGGEVQLAWSEFEVVEQQLAVRITRLV
jgi:flagellar motor switch/type III secretory pathway protein FliN